MIYLLHDPALPSSIDGPGSSFEVETVASKIRQTSFKEQLATASAVFGAMTPPNQRHPFWSREKLN